MVIDSSALLCLLLGEPDAARIAQALDESTQALIAAPTLVEATIVIEARLGARGVVNLQSVMQAAGIQVVAFSADEAQVASEAWRRFGRGRHEAALDYGDCMSYATAITHQAPLLFVGDDFSKTDVPAAV